MYRKHKLDAGGDSLKRSADRRSPSPTAPRKRIKMESIYPPGKRMYSCARNSEITTGTRRFTTQIVLTFVLIDIKMVLVCQRNLSVACNTFA